MAQQPTSPIVRSYLKRKRWTSKAADSVAISVLNRWSRFLAERNISSVLDATADDACDYLAWRQESVCGTTAHKDYQHLCWLYRWLVAEGEVDASRRPGVNDDGIMNGVPAPRITDTDPDRTQRCDDEAFAALMNSFDPRKLTDCRDAAMMSFMYRSGVRGVEVERCDRDRLRLDDEHPYIDVPGKGTPLRWRKVPVALETAVWIERYLRRLGPGFDGDGAPLFVSTYNGTPRSARDPRMSAQAIRSMMKRRCAAADVHVTTHMFRRGFAIAAKRRGLNDTTICAVAGWSDARMLDRYQRAERAELAAAEFHAADDSAPRVTNRRRRILRSA